MGRADAAFSTIPFFLPVVSQTRPSNAVRFADFGLNMPSFGLFANESKSWLSGATPSRASPA